MKRMNDWFRSLMPMERTMPSTALNIRQFRANLLPLLLMLLLALAGQLRLLGSYQPCGDDNPYLHYTTASGLMDWFNIRGIWRIAGPPLSLWLVKSHVYGPVAILFHGATGFLIYLAGTRILKSGLLSLAVAAVWTAFPWAYTSVSWASTFNFMFSTFLFWLIVILLIDAGATDRPTTPFHRVITFAVVFGLSILALLACEAVLFVIFFSGLVLLGSGASSKNWRSLLTLGVAPAAAASTWAIVYKLCETADMPKEITTLNWRPILSGIYYQYANFDTFELFFNKALFQTAVESTPVVFALLFAAAAGATYFVMRRTLANQTLGARDLDVRSRLLYLAAFVVLLEASVAVYVLGGGYGLDAHKRYPIASIGIMLIGIVLTMPAIRAHIDERILKKLLVPVSMFGIVLTFLVVNLQVEQMAKLNALLDLIVKEKLGPEVAVRWNPNIHDIWPNAERSFGIRLDSPETIHLGMVRRDAEPVTLTTEGDPLVEWDKGTKTWRIVRHRASLKAGS